MKKTLLLSSFLISPLAAQDLREAEFMARAEKGFSHIYNLDYDDAVRTFAGLKREYPQHPAPPLYLAIVAWLRELFERQELDLNTFAAPGYFTKPTDRKMPAERRSMFFDNVQESQKLSQKILSQSPQHKDARYFLGSSHGILGSFAITIDRNTRQAFGHGKQAYKLHHDLVEQDPQFYDAYMSVGLYEYVVANLPWYIKWLAIIIGYRGSEERGFKYLTLASEKGRFVADDARTLLMVLYVHEGRNAAALENARYLHQRFPRNYILHLNRAQILERIGRKEQAIEEYRQLIRMAEARMPNYQNLPLKTFRYEAGKKFIELKQPTLALEQFEKSLAHPETPEREKALSHLGAGQALDMQGKRSQAVEHYQHALKFRDYDGSHSLAKKFLKTPYEG